MIVTAYGATIVSKTRQVWRDGDVSYRVMMTAGDQTNPVVLDVDTKAEWESLKELDVRYDCDINIETNGYKHYHTLIAAKEQ